MNMLLTARQLDRLRDLPPDHKVLTARDGSPILQRPDGGLWRVQPNGSLAQASAARDVCCPRPAVENAGTCRDTSNRTNLAQEDPVADKDRHTSPAWTRWPRRQGLTAWA